MIERRILLIAALAAFGLGLQKGASAQSSKRLEPRHQRALKLFRGINGMIEIKHDKEDQNG